MDISFESAESMRRSKLQHQIGCRNETRLDCGLRGLVPERDGQMCFPDTRWTSKMSLYQFPGLFVMLRSAATTRTFRG